MDIDNFSLEEQVCGDYVNGLKRNDLMMVENEFGSEPTSTEVGNPEFVEGGDDLVLVGVIKEGVCADRVNGFEGNDAMIVENKFGSEPTSTKVGNPGFVEGGDGLISVEAIKEGFSADRVNGLEGDVARIVENNFDSEPTSTEVGNPESVQGGGDSLSVVVTKETSMEEQVCVDDAIVVENDQDAEPTAAEDEYLESVEGGSDMLTLRLTEEGIVFTAGDPVSVENASGNEDGSSGIESEDQARGSIVETDIPNASVACCTIGDSDEAPVPRQDTHEVVEDHAAHQPSFFPDESLVRCVDQGLECELDVTLDICFDTNEVDSASQVDENVVDAQEIHDRDAIADVMFADSNAGHSPRNDTNNHEQPSVSDKSLVKCVDQHLDVAVSDVTNSDIAPMQDEHEESEVGVANEQPPFVDESLVRSSDQQEEGEPEASEGECLVKSTTDGVAQDDTNMVGIPEILMQDEIDENNGRVSDEQPPFFDESLARGSDQQEDCKPDISVGECLVNKKISLEGLEEMPKQDENDDSEGRVSIEQPLCVDESLVGGSNQQEECEPDISVAECLANSATDGVSWEDINMKGIEENPKQDAVDESKGSVTDEQPSSDEYPSFVDESLAGGSDQQEECVLDIPVGECLVKSSTDGVALDNTNMEGIAEMPKQDENEALVANEQPSSDEQPSFFEESLVGGSDQQEECEPDISVGECLVKSVTGAVALDDINMDEIEEMPKQVENDEIVSCVADEQPPFVDESLFGGSDQQEDCEHDLSVGDCLVISDTDGFVLDDINMEDIEETPQQDENDDSEGRLADEQLPFVDEPLAGGSGQQEECEPDMSIGECLDESATYGAALDELNIDGIQEMQEVAFPIQQIELPEEQLVDEHPDSDSVNPQSKDENIASHESFPTQQVELPEEVYEDLVFDSINPQSNDDINVRYGSTSTQQVELAEEEIDEDPDSDSDSDSVNRIKEENIASHESVPQQVELPEEVYQDPVSDLANPQSNDDNIVRHGFTFTQQVELPEEVGEDRVSNSAKRRSKDEKSGRRGSSKPRSTISNHRVTYQLPHEDEGDFSVFDLVWGKVKSHPWWPGQIFHPSDSSEKAMKYYKKDCYLVAYFGDRSFAWNDASVLKPFKKHFPMEEKQSNTESFQNAVSCALKEVSRRVELGLSCPCISETAYEKIKYQIVENGGIREESSKREGVDRSTGPDTFHSAKLIEYVRALAISPTCGTNRLEVAIAKSQLLAFNRLKGCDALAEFQHFGLTEFDVENSLSGEKETLAGETEFGGSAAGDDGKTKMKGTRKRKHDLKDIVYQRRKEKSLTELMGETIYYLDGDFDSLEEDDMMLTSPKSGSKRKASKYLAGDFTSQPSTKTISFAKVSHTTSSNPKPQQSFKVGECIRRVASQLTGSSSIIKCASDGSDSKVIGDDVDEVIDAPDESVTESTMIPQKQSSPEEMISQLHLSARDPMKGYNFLGDIISFFYEFRNIAVTAQCQKLRKGAGKKRKSSDPVVGKPEAFEFDERNDSYWTDMVVQNSSEAKPAKRGRRKKENQILDVDVDVDSEKPVKSTKRKYSRKQYFHGNQEPAAEMIPSRDETQAQLPTELMLVFGDVGSLPSQANLNKMFKRFGPLKESETEIDAEGSRAKVVFKKRSDAEVAYSSATKFNIFGSALVNYQLNYTPSVSFGTSPRALSNTIEHGT